MPTPGSAALLPAASAPLTERSYAATGSYSPGWSRSCASASPLPTGGRPWWLRGLPPPPSLGYQNSEIGRPTRIDYIIVSACDDSNIDGLSIDWTIDLGHRSVDHAAVLATLRLSRDAPPNLGLGIQRRRPVCARTACSDPIKIKAFTDLLGSLPPVPWCVESHTHAAIANAVVRWAAEACLTDPPGPKKYWVSKDAVALIEARRPWRKHYLAARNASKRWLQ